MNSTINSPVLSFTLTRQCNLDCIYCYFPNKGNKSITKEIIDSVIEQYFKFLTKGIHEVRFLLSGGEPLLEKELVFYIIKKGASEAKKYGKEISYTLDSNGVLLTKQIVERLQPYHVYIMSSIDGDTKIHDSQRPFRNSGHGSHSIVVNNVANALEKLGNGNVAVRYTILPNRAQYLYETFQYFFKFGFKIIDFAPNYEVEWKNKDIDIYMSEIYKVVKFIIEKQIDNKLIGNYIQWILGHDQKISAYGHPCGIIPTVDTNGDFYSCHRFIDNQNFYLGNYTNFSQILTSIRNISQQYLKYWDKFGYYALGSCPANNECHGAHPFSQTVFFEKFINGMKRQVKKAVLEDCEYINIQRIMSYDVNMGINDNEYMLVNSANGEYLLLNKTGGMIAQILGQYESCTLKELVNEFMENITANESVDYENVKNDIFQFIKALQKEKILFISI